MYVAYETTFIVAAGCVVCKPQGRFYCIPLFVELILVDTYALQHTAPTDVGEISLYKFLQKTIRPFQNTNLALMDERVDVRSKSVGPIHKNRDKFVHAFVTSSLVCCYFLSEDSSWVRTLLHL